MIKLSDETRVYVRSPMPDRNAAPVAAEPGRNVALDFTKGGLVVLMVAYHSLNYFRYDLTLLRHLHFLPTSFIFIAGFLITHVYLSKVRAGDRGVYSRLFVRGLKTLALFVALNLAVHALFAQSYNRQLGLDVFFANLDAIFLTGERRAAVFGVLLPISYLLLLSAGLLRVARVIPHGLPVFAGLTLIGCALLEQAGRLTFNIDLVSMGVLGMAAGFISRRRLDRSAALLPAIVGAYLVYSFAVYLRYPTYLPNIVGVALSVLLLYAVGSRVARDGFLARNIALLGNYSLFSYLAQIAVLQLLFRLGRQFHFLAADVLLPFALTVLATFAAVKLLDLARRRAPVADRIYRSVFA
jgi:peptidoglycan/LPS O-acetylase OafA/YrhL